MTDEIAGARGGPPRRRSWGVLLLGVAVLFGYVVTHRYPAPAPAHGLPAPQVPRPLVDGPPLVEPELVGRTGPGPEGLRLLVDGADPRIIDAHTLSVTPVPGLNLPPGIPAQLVQLGHAGIAALAPLYGPNGGMYLVRPGVRPLLLGAEGLYMASNDGGILTATYRPGGTTVSGRTLDRRVRWLWQLPGNVLPLRDTPAGLVVAQYANAVASDAELLLIDRRTGNTVRRLGHGQYAVASDDRALAWVPLHCDVGCAVMVTDLATGATRRYPVYRRPMLAAGAFAPDGGRLALTFAGVAADGAGPLERGTVGIMDLRTGAKVFVPHLSTPPSEHADVTWSADGRWLVLGVRFPREERIAFWRPGEEATILPTVLPGEPTTATVSALP